MAAFMVVAAVYALLLWVHIVKLIPERRAICACRHVQGDLHPGVQDRYGRKTALIWECRTCPLQIPLKLNRLGEIDGEIVWQRIKEPK